MTKFYNSKYIDKTTVRNYNAFAEEYFCGTDINVELNGKETPLVAIEYTLQEQLKPIYGYASRVYDDIAKGSRIVVGTFIAPVRNNANNPEFTNSEKSDKNTPENFNISYDEQLHEERKRLALREKQSIKANNISFKSQSEIIKRGTKLYLSPTLNNHFDTTKKKYSIEIKQELKNHFFVYIKDLNVNCFIKRSEL